MGYARRGTTKSALRTYAAKGKRKRTSNVTKVRFQRPTAKNQQKQILSNARMVSKLYKSVMSKRVFCDWQYARSFTTPAPDPEGFTRSWFALPLTDFSQWAPVMRRDSNVAESSSTFVQRMVINMRYQLKASSYAQYNIWIVTPRKDAAGNDIVARLASGDPTQIPQAGIEYVEGADAFNMRLNPAVYKVHYAAYKTLTETTLFLDAQQPAGNPFTTWSKGQATIKCGINVRVPVLNQPWTVLPPMQQAYYKRYIMLACIVHDANPEVTPLNSAEFTFDMLATTINDT